MFYGGSSHSGGRRDSGGFQGSWNISLGDGGDWIANASFKNGDSVDMGAGNDIVDVRIDNDVKHTKLFIRHTLVFQF